MSGRVGRIRDIVTRSPGLAALAIAAAGLALLHGVPFISVAALLLVFVLPGIAVVAALLPRAVLGTWEAAVLSIGVSLALVIGTGLVLNLAPGGLDPTLWTILLAAITVAAAVVAMIREELAPLAGRQSQSPDGRPSAQPAMPRRREAWQMAGALTVTILLIAASRIMVESRPSTFTQLWMIEGALPGAVEIGVRNEEGVAVDYVLKLHSNGAAVDDIQISLDPGRAWSLRLMLDAPDSQEITAELYRLPDQSRPYRRVSLSRVLPSSLGGADGGAVLL